MRDSAHFGQNKTGLGESSLPNSNRWGQLQTDHMVVLPCDCIPERSHFFTLPLFSQFGHSWNWVNKKFLYLIFELQRDLFQGFRDFFFWNKKRLKK